MDPGKKERTGISIGLYIASNSTQAVMGMKDSVSKNISFQNQKSTRLDLRSKEDLKDITDSLLHDISGIVFAGKANSGFTGEDIISRQWQLVGLIEARLKLLIMTNPERISKNETAMFKTCFDSYNKLYEQIKGRKVKVTNIREDLATDPELMEMEQKLNDYDNLREKLKELERANRKTA